MKFLINFFKMLFCRPKYKLIDLRMTLVPTNNYTLTSYRDIECIVIHCTATDNLESVLNTFTDRASSRSAHYIIDKKGIVIQLVPVTFSSWHAGKSEFKGKTDVNGFSVGIELLHPNTLDGVYTQDQLDSLTTMCFSLCETFKIPVESIVGHADIAPGRKTDPVGFPWKDFRKSVKYYLDLI